MDYRELQQTNSTTVPANDTLPGLPRQADSESGCQQPPILPFIGRILEHRPRQSMRAERWLDVNEDRHLADHVFVDALAVKPVSSCLPVIPMTLCMEMMAEAAACLAPGYGLIGFENLRAVRWIQMTDTDRLRIELSASVTEIDQAQEFCRIAVTLRSEDQSNSACEASVLFASRYRLSVVPRFTGLTNATVHPLPAERFYQERYLFHGPSYHALTGSIVLGDQGAAGHLIVKSPAGFFRSTQSPQFLTDPALLDAVGQLIGIWAMERERYAFPIGVEKLEIAAEAAARELAEEGGVEPTETPTLFGFYANHANFPNDHIVFYRVGAWRPVPPRIGNEIAARGFFARDALPDGVTKGTLRRLAEVFDGATLNPNW